jgi:poly(A) polymerase
MKLSVSRILEQIPEKEILLSLYRLATSEGIKLYVVGGTVRDVILGRPVYDIDFTMSGDALSFTERFAKLTKAKAIILDEEQKSARAIFHHGELYMDFNTIRGNDIIDDLKARDLTINAIAYDFNQLFTSDEVELIDPCNGIDDLNNRIINLTSPQTIVDDPIRMLRVYRFSATLNFTVSDETLSLISTLSTLLSKVSVERIRDELFKILDVNNSAKYIKALDNVGIIEQIFPEIISMKGMTQNEYHHLDVWDHSMLSLDFFEQQIIPDSLQDYSPEIEAYLNFSIVKGRNIKSLLKLAVLLHDIGKPLVRTIDKNGRIRFFDHHFRGAELALNIGIHLRLANRESKFISDIIGYHMYPLSLCTDYNKKHISQRNKERYALRFVQRTEAECLAVLLLSFADLRATKGPWRKDRDLEDLNRLIGEIAKVYFREKQFPMAQLITGDDLMKEFDLSSSPIVGKLLKSIRKAQFEGKLKTRQEALELARKNLRQYGNNGTDD